MQEWMDSLEKIEQKEKEISALEDRLSALQQQYDDMTAERDTYRKELTEREREQLLLDQKRMDEISRLQAHIQQQQEEAQQHERERARQSEQQDQQSLRVAFEKRGIHRKEDIAQVFKKVIDHVDVGEQLFCNQQEMTDFLWKDCHLIGKHLPSTRLIR